MPKSATWINKQKATAKEQTISLEKGSGFYLVIAKLPVNSKRFVGKTRIASKSLSFSKKYI